MLEKDVVLNDFRSVVIVSNGVKVLCKRIPPMLLAAFERSHREPRPPMKEVEVLGGKKVFEECPTDPDYQRRLAEFENKRAQNFYNLAIDFLELLDEDEDERDKRSARLERYGLPDNEQERLETFALDDPQADIQVLTEELMCLSTITPGEVKQQMEFFRPEVDGDAGTEAPDAKVSPGIRVRAVEGIP